MRSGEKRYKNDADEIKHIVNKLWDVKQDPHSCPIIATKVAKMLIQGSEKVEIVTDQTDVTYYKGGGSELDAAKRDLGITDESDKEDFKPTEFFKYLQESPSGSVFIVDTPDDSHSYNIIKYQDTLYLIDNNIQVFKKINSLDDFYVKERDFNYIKTTEKHEIITAYKAGEIHPKYILTSNKEDDSKENSKNQPVKTQRL